MRFSPENLPEQSYAPDRFQQFALAGMLVLTIMSFVGANLQAVLWRSSDWLVSTVLPAVVVKLTNQERADLSQAPLRRSAILDEAARQKAEHMAKNEYFAHYAPDGTSPWFWFKQVGYTYAHAGENLAIHFSDSSEVIEAWMNSPKHRENIVASKFTEIGVGTAKGMYEGYETVYVVQLFGTPAEVPVVKTTPTPVPKPAPVRTPTAQPVATTPSREVVLAETASTSVTEVTAREEDTPATTTTIAGLPDTTEPTSVTEDPSGALVIEKDMVSTSSGLAVANMTQTVEESEAAKAGLATRPNRLLEIAYIIFGLIVVGLLIASVVVETRKRRFVQSAYGAGLLVLMVGLWYVNALLTTGATIL